jgi:WD40-like Beta Propeller Repeat
VRAVCGVGSIAFALALGMNTVAEASFPGAPGKIAFSAGGPADIAIVNADGSGLVNVTNTRDLDEVAPEWSPDGQKLLFTRERTQTWMTDADGSVVTPVPILGARHANWSPDGRKVVFARYASGSFCTSLHTANLDGTDERLVLADTAGPCYKELPDWSRAEGGLIVFSGGTYPDAEIYTVRVDGSDLTGPIADGRAPEWSPAGGRIMYDAPANNFVGGTIRTVNPDGSSDLPLNPFTQVDGEDGTWAPDGTRVLFVGHNGLRITDDAGGNLTQITFFAHYQPDWQPLPPLPPAESGYPRPQGASPLSVPLVPAYRACTNPNRTHGPPLDSGSCAPPQQTSGALTVGTPDANGEPAASIGRVRFRTVVGDPATTADEADVLVGATLTDVRCRLAMPAYCTGGALSDYIGGLELTPVIRITDKHSGGAERDPATGFDLISFSVPVTCTDTPSSPEGSTCNAQTSLDALAPGTIREGKRAVWALSEIAVRDAGIDDPRVDAYTTFAVQGVFVP